MMYPSLKYCVLASLIGVFLIQFSLAIPTSSPHHPRKAYVGIDLTWEPFAPDGFSRNAILTNGQFPGPPLEVDEGDDVEFFVKNNLPFAITIHFHGVEQLNTPWSDGVPGLSQRLIQSGESFVYRWNANQYGTYWYHAHARSHVSDGLYGPILVRPSKHEPSAFWTISNNISEIHAMRRAENNPRPLIVSDWSHFTSEEFFDIETSAGIDNFCIDSILINGKGSVFCLPQDEINRLTSPTFKQILNGSTLTPKGCFPANLTIFQGNFTHDFSKVPPTAFDVCEPSRGAFEVVKVDAAEGWVSINIISAASINTLLVSIDEHPLWIYAIDGRHIIPEAADAVLVPNGNRYSALVKLDKPVGDYTIRVATVSENQIVSGFAMLSYKGSKHNNTSCDHNNTSSAFTNHNNTSSAFIHHNHTSRAFIDYAGMNTTADVVFFDDTKIVPFPPIAPAATADATHFLVIDGFGESWKWTLSGKESYSLNLDTEVPLLFDPTQAEALNPNLTIVTKMGQWIDLVITSNPPLQPAHPLHKHSNKAFIIGAGTGAFNWSTTAEAIREIPQFFNLANPPYRDGFTTIPSSLTEPTWMVVRYQVVNPGAFLFHCHIQSHLAGGMAIALLDGVDAFPQVPPEYMCGNGFLPLGFGPHAK